MKEPIANRIMYVLKTLVGVPLVFSACTVLLPLMIPPCFAEWFYKHVIRPYAPFLGRWNNDWPTIVSVLYVLFWYAYFIVVIVFMFNAKRLWTFLIYLAIFVASTWAAVSSFPVGPCPR